MRLLPLRRFFSAMRFISAVRLLPALYILPFALIAAPPCTCSAQEGFVQTGMASFYGPEFHGRKTATGETFSFMVISKSTIETIKVIEEWT